jgi:citrate synthase
MADSLTITDNRTGKQYEIPIDDGAIRAMDLRQIRTSPDDFGLMTYDPAFQNTAACRSRITFIDGDRGILRYRGYPIEQLAEQSTYLETAYLLLAGDLPASAALEGWTRDIADHAALPASIPRILTGFEPDAHPMGMFLAAVAALSASYPDAKHVGDDRARGLQIRRLIGQTATIAAALFRHRTGQPAIAPDPRLSYPGRFLHMLFDRSGSAPNPVFERALDILFILHADHEQNCSTSAMRSIGSSQADPYAALAGAAAALYGPLHGGANEAVVRMLQEIGTVDQVPAFITRVKRGDLRLMGFGHRVYKSYDPRARIIKQTADQVFEAVGRSPLLDVALELERIALSDEYFVSRKLYPNVDFYSGLIYQALGFPVAMFPVLFAIPRTAGWLAQWDEMVRDREQKIARPRQIYVGADRREYVPVDARTPRSVTA